MFGALLGGAASIIGGVLSSKSQKKAAQSAQQSQEGMSREAIAEQKRQFDQLQSLLKPYVQGGKNGLYAQQNLLGLMGDDAQQQAISGIENSPFFKSQYQQAENALLQNASATGGLRGGNFQEALADNRSNMLYNNVQGQIQNLGGLATNGQNAAAGVGIAGQNMANQVGQQLNDIGAGQAGYALAKGQANQNMWGNILGGAGALIQGGQQARWF